MQHDSEIKVLCPGTMEDFKVYASRGTVLSPLPWHCITDTCSDVPNLATVMGAKRDTIARFIYVVLPLLDVYKLPRSSIHFYFDQTGKRIAFNRNASLFLSLRYFEAWRMYGHALISTLLTVYVSQMIKMCSKGI